MTLREVKPQYVSAGAWADVQPYYWYFPEVNQHLRAALTRHPELALADWAALADQPGLSYDAIHLNTTGAALYARLLRTEVDGIGRLPGGQTLEVAVAGTHGVPGRRRRRRAQRHRRRSQVRRLRHGAAVRRAAAVGVDRSTTSGTPPWPTTSS